MERMGLVKEGAIWHDSGGSREPQEERRGRGPGPGPDPDTDWLSPLPVEVTLGLGAIMFPTRAGGLVSSHGYRARGGGD